MERPSFRVKRMDKQRPDIMAAEKAGETRTRERRASCAMSRT